MLPKAPNNPTAHRLIEAGLHLFGRKGFDGTSTRELAAHAETNIASIAYHFGGKAGLRTACVQRVGHQVSAVFDMSLTAGEPATPEAARGRIEALVRAFVQLIVGAPQAHDMITFIMRELTDSGEATDTIYAEFIGPGHKALCGLWATATGLGAKDETVKLTIFAVIGQIFYFRIARPIVERRMGWDDIGQTETGKIAEIVIANLRDSMERHGT